MSTITKLSGSKFFEGSYTLYSGGVTAVATHGTSAANNMLALNQDIRWQSVGAASDATTGTVVITLPAAKTISRIWMTGHNLKAYTIKHDSAVDFTNVSDLDGTLVGGIAETAYDKSTSYYEFDPVSATTITIAYSSTQITNQEKYIAVFVATEEIGTFTYPYTVRNGFTRNSRNSRTLSGKQIIQKNYEFYSASVNITMLPTESQTDVTLIESLHLRETPFLFWPCGGHFGTSFFKLTLRGWRLQDLYKVQLTSALNEPFLSDIWLLPISTTLNLEEVI